MNQQAKTFERVITGCGGLLPRRRGRAEQGEVLIEVRLNDRFVGEAVFRGRVPDDGWLKRQIQSAFPRKAVSIVRKGKRRRSLL